MAVACGDGGGSQFAPCRAQVRGRGVGVKERLRKRGTHIPNHGPCITPGHAFVEPWQVGELYVPLLRLNVLQLDLIRRVIQDGTAVSPYTQKAVPLEELALWRKQVPLPCLGASSLISRRQMLNASWPLPAGVGDARGARAHGFDAELADQGGAGKASNST